MMEMPLILRLDASGLPMQWIPWQRAVCLYTRDLVIWTAGENMFSLSGGTSRATGKPSIIVINSIIAIKRPKTVPYLHRDNPPLNNYELFRRDSQICLYCGQRWKTSSLTRDHVVPKSLGGKDIWSNVVTACRACNTKKGGRTPEKAGMRLLAIPYAPNWAEFLALSNRRILADQMEFLKSQFKQATTNRKPE